MSVVTIVGDPDKVCATLDSLISSGASINIVKKTKNNSTYIVEYSTFVPPTEFYLLKEDGSYLLLESGDKIILES
jgi:hypothetical protein